MILDSLLSVIVAELAESRVRASSFYTYAGIYERRPHYREAPFNFACAASFSLRLFCDAGLVFIHLQSADGPADLDMDPG